MAVYAPIAYVQPSRLSKYQDLYDPDGDGSTRNLNQSGRDATFGDVSPAFSDFEQIEACLRREKQFNRRVELNGLLRRLAGELAAPG